MDCVLNSTFLNGVNNDPLSCTTGLWACSVLSADACLPLLVGCEWNPTQHILTPSLCIEQYKCFSQRCISSREAWSLIWQPVSTHIPAATSTSHLKSTLRKLSHAGICETGLKSQSLLSKEALSIHLHLHSCIHSDAQCHLKGRNWIQKKINMINCYLFCP